MSDGKPPRDFFGGVQIRITEEETRLIQEVVEEYCGLAHGLDSGFFLERRLGARLDALGLSNYRDYYHYLRYDPNGPREMEELIERITTHETYFFRETYQLEALREEILPELHRRLSPKRRLLLWSAGCSTGEEVYTLAMILLEDGRFRDWAVRVVGSDISRKVVAQARSGTYGPSSFRATDDYYKRKYFQEVEGKYRIRDNVRAMCSFGQLNLLATERFQVFGSCDVVLCRNVLMYLAGHARQKIIDSFYEVLTPGGYLLLGHSESLLNLSTRFDLVHLIKDLVYRRPLT